MRLTEKLECGGYCINTELDYAESVVEMIQRYGQLEDIEEELGVDLTTLSKALKNGVYYKLNLGQTEKVDGVSLYYRNSVGWFVIHFKYRGYDIWLNTEDYGETWALTEKELQ